MPTLDVFKGDAFSMFNMTDSINRVPFVPRRLQALNLFDKKGIRTTSFGLERQGRNLALVPSKPRGGPGTSMKADKRAERLFNVPHCPLDDQILAQDIQNIRSFGSENELLAVADVVNEKLDAMRRNLEATQEFYRVGAVSGRVLDSDGSTELVNLFTEFSISESSVDFVLGTSTTAIRNKCDAVSRLIEAALGGVVATGYHAICGDTFWDKLTVHAEVKAAYANAQSNAFLRESQRAQGRNPGGFEFGGIFWENYRGGVGSVPFVAASECRFFAEGVPGLFLERYAPADTLDAANTTGKPFYAMQQPLDYNKGIRIQAQTNTLCICTIPESLVKGTTSN